MSSSYYVGDPPRGTTYCDLHGTFFGPCPECLRWLDTVSKYVQEPWLRPDEIMSVELTPEDVVIATLVERINRDKILPVFVFAEH